MKGSQYIFFLLVSFSLTLPLGGVTPNILFIVSEDNGPEIGCYGTPIDTPHLDELARQGTLFGNAYVPQAGCSQSRAAFLTGLYPHQNGQIGLATWNYSMYSGKIPNMVSVLKKAGYRTGIIGKLHVKPKDAFPFDFKAITSSNFARKKMHSYAAEAKRFLADGNKPFYLQVNYPDAHRPFIKTVDNLPHKPLTGKDVDALPCMGINHPELRQQTADYYNCMMRLDAYIGELLKVLESSGRAESTVVVYIGDHGADLLRGKRTCYEGGVKIPMIIRWPGAKGGQKRMELVSSLDLFPTFCEIAKTSLPDRFNGGYRYPGRSLNKLIHGASPKWRTYLFTEYHLHSNHNPWPQRAVRGQRYKLIFNPLAGEVNPGYAFTMGKKFFDAPEEQLLAEAPEQVRQAYGLMRSPPRHELYDLQEDPHEFNNLADDPVHAKTLQRLQSVLTRWQKDSGDALVFPQLSRKLFELIREAGTKERKVLDYQFMKRKP
ncbi:MAG: sulfatase [Verrucomicrobiaceae bacterium]|nr:sulfatase [Verrucomicrobiaceae bacterium]